MLSKLFLSAICKFLLGIFLVGALVFVPAGSLAFTNAWILMGVLFLPMLFVGVVLLMKNPQLLQERLNVKEKEKDQQLVVKLSGLMFLVGFVVAGLGYRLHWYRLPVWVSIGAAVVFLFAYVMYAEALRENTYLSRTIKVQAGQKVVDTGLYGMVRHPMYSATVLLFLMIPLVLGSLYAFLVFFAYLLIIAKRIKGEEKLLAAQLDGYSAYMKKVKYRLFPFVW